MDRSPLRRHRADQNPAQHRPAAQTDTVYSRVFDIAQGSAWPPEYGGRALRNDFTDRWIGREGELADDHAARDQPSTARETADYDTAYIYAGQAVGLVERERSATEIVAELAEGRRAATQPLAVTDQDKKWIAHSGPSTQGARMPILN